VIDATGLRVHGAGEWLAETHGQGGRRTWRKLHLAVDPSTGEILACELTSNEEATPLRSARCLSKSLARSPR
jgi:Transposase DDE domain